MPQVPAYNPTQSALMLAFSVAERGVTYLDSPIVATATRSVSAVLLCREDVNDDKQTSSQRYLEVNNRDGSFVARLYVRRRGVARKAAVWFTKIYGINVLLRAWLCLLRVPPINVRPSTGQPGWRRLGIRY